MIDLELLQRAVMDSRDGIVIADARAPDMPLVFVNPAFERMTGYCEAEVLGRNCRFLQGGEALPTSDRATLHAAIATGEGVSVTLQNFRRDGTAFWNELSLSPIHNRRGEVTHFIGFQHDVTQRKLAETQMRAQTDDLVTAKAELEKLVTVDPLTGVYNRRHFDSRLETLWKFAGRTAEPLALFFIDIDCFKEYNDRFGHPAGDRVLIAVANALADSFQRGSDFLARYGGDEFIVVAGGMKPDPAARFARRLCKRVRKLAISHPDTPSGELTISVGYAVTTPQPTTLWQDAVVEADRALFAAKAAGRDRAAGTPAIAMAD